EITLRFYQQFPTSGHLFQQLPGGIPTLIIATIAARPTQDALWNWFATHHTGHRRLIDQGSQGHLQPLLGLALLPTTVLPMHPKQSRDLGMLHALTSTIS